MPIGIASICNAAARPYRVDSTDPISVIQWTSPAGNDLRTQYQRGSREAMPEDPLWYWVTEGHCLAAR